MKSRFRMLSAAALMVAIVAVPADAGAQVTGTWELATEGPRGNQTMMLVLTMDGEALTGSLTMQRRGGGGGGGRGGPGGGGPPEMTLSDGSVEGDAFAFTVTFTMRGNPVTQEFTGTVDGDQMSGTISAPNGDRPFTGERSG